MSVSRALVAAAAAAVTITLGVLAPAVADAGNGAKLTRFLPDNTRMVMVLDVAAARDSDLFKRGVDFLMSQAGADASARLKTAGIDLLRDVDTVVISGGGDDLGALEDKVVILEGRFDAQKLASLSTTATVKTSKVGVTYWAEKETAAALIDGRLFITDADGIEAVTALARGKAKGRSLARSRKAARLRAVVAATDTRHDAWCAAILPPDASAKAAGLGASVDAVSVAVGFGRTVAGEVHLHALDDAGATTIVDQLQPVLAQATSTLDQIGLGAFARSLVLERDGAIVEARFAVTTVEISTLVGMAGGMLGVQP